MRSFVPSLCSFLWLDFSTRKGMKKAKEIVTSLEKVRKSSTNDRNLHFHTTLYFPSTVSEISIFFDFEVGNRVGLVQNLKFVAKMLKSASCKTILSMIVPKNFLRGYATIEGEKIGFFGGFFKKNYKTKSEILN